MIVMYVFAGFIFGVAPLGPAAASMVIEKGIVVGGGAGVAEPTAGLPPEPSAP